MLRNKFILIFVGIIILIPACDPYGGYEYWIDNQSDSVIFVSYSEYSNDSIKIKELKQGEGFVLAHLETISGLYDKSDDFLIFFDSLGIYIDTVVKREISKDYLNRGSWNYEQEATGMMGKSGENIYTLTIGIEDL